MIVRVRNRVKASEIESLVSNSVLNMVYSNPQLGRILDKFILEDHVIRNVINKNFKALGRPNVTMHGYESTPGIWILYDDQTDITFYLWSDCHRKNCFKGTSYEFVGDPAKLHIAFQNLIDYLKVVTSNVVAI